MPKLWINRFLISSLRIHFRFWPTEIKSVRAKEKSAAKYPLCKSFCFKEAETLEKRKKAENVQAL